VRRQRGGNTAKCDEGRGGPLYSYSVMCHIPVAACTHHGCAMLHSVSLTYLEGECDSQIVRERERADCVREGKKRMKTNIKKGRSNIMMRKAYAMVMSAREAFCMRRLYHFVTFSWRSSLGLGARKRVICSINAEENLSNGSRTYFDEKGREREREREREKEREKERE
jgi:hypothetical protein